MADLEVTAQLCAAIETMNAAMARQEERNRRMAMAVRQIPLSANQAALTAGAGTIDQPDSLMVRAGYYWSVRRLTLSGFTAGTAVVYLNGAGGEPFVPYAQAGTFTFGRGELLMHPGDRLVAVATGITGYVQLNGAADCFEQWYLPYYIG
jgi:hypothetical protein